MSSNKDSDDSKESSIDSSTSDEEEQQHDAIEVDEVENVNGVGETSSDSSEDLSESDEDIINLHYKLEGSFVWSEECQEFSKSGFVRMIRNESVKVVGIFGKQRLLRSQSYVSKNDILNNFIQNEVFPIEQDNQTSQTKIEGYYDRNRRLIFLNLNSIFDTDVMLTQLRKANNQMEKDGFYSFTAHPLYESCKLILFLFHICHIVILYHPTYVLDLTYIHLFKVLENTRAKLQMALSETIKSLDGKEFTKDWKFYGRQCPPRLLFYFASPPIDLIFPNMVKREGPKPTKVVAIRKFEDAIEEHIYQLFRKTRVVTSSLNCLFNLCPREGFAFVDNDRGSSYCDPLLASMRKFYSHFEDPMEVEEKNINHLIPYYMHQNTSDLKPSIKSFNKFLQIHLDSISAKGTDGDGKNEIKEFRIGPWFQTCEQLRSMVFSSCDEKIFDVKNASNNQMEEHSLRASDILGNYVDYDLKFSDIRCNKAYYMAMAAYREGSPNYYLEDYHKMKTQQAIGVYLNSATGFYTKKYQQILEVDCQNFWKSGREMCGELSLTGNHCNNRRHVIQSEDKENKEKKKNLPTMPHKSEVLYNSACNCGRRQFDREDPFTILDANYSFFFEVEQECCEDLEHVKIPVYLQNKPSLNTSSTAKELTIDKDNSLSFEIFNLDINSEEKSNDKDEKDSLRTKETLQTLADYGAHKNSVRQVSTIDPIPYLLTKDTPNGKMPLFPSWSLVQLGSSHLYEHSNGVKQPGFLSNCKSLHMWDVSVKNLQWENIQQSWPNLADLLYKKSISPVKGKPLSLNVKVFIGFEYECPRGHRFIAASNDKAIRSQDNRTLTSSQNRLRDSATKLLASDMPLYMSCPNSLRAQPCNLLGQLMRIHVVTPKAPIHVTLFPFVQPILPEGPIFHTGWNKPIKLPMNTYWVLRLPFIYSGESGTHVPPKNNSECMGRLLKGVIGISEEFEADPLNSI